MELVRAPPTLYCDGAAVMRQVIEVDGTYPDLRRGDHCVIPLNLARGAFRPFDLFIDFLSSLDLIHFHHHFIVLNDVLALKEGEQAFVAEFTNTPADFLTKATAVGYSGALFDKADYRRSPLSDYYDGIVYRMVPTHPLTENQRDQIVSRAQKYLAIAKDGNFVTYNAAIRNCETIATAITKRRSASMDSTDSTKTNTRSTTTSKQSGGGGGDVANAAGGSSPQVNFAAWNTFRFMLQCVGVVFLYYFALSDSVWWNTNFVGFIMLCAVPVLLQSIFLFVQKAHQLRLMWLRGTLGSGSYKHLLFKEMFRLLLVGFVSTGVIMSVPFLMLSRKLDWYQATVVALFVYAVINLVYSVLAQSTFAVCKYNGGCPGGRSRRLKGEEVVKSKSGSDDDQAEKETKKKKQ